jgi:hypothetical protein
MSSAAKTELCQAVTISYATQPTGEIRDMAPGSITDMLVPSYLSVC